MTNDQDIFGFKIIKEGVPQGRNCTIFPTFFYTLLASLIFFVCFYCIFRLFEVGEGEVCLLVTVSVNSHFDIQRSSDLLINLLIPIFYK